MRWTDFKNIITESEDDDDDFALPSKTMVAGEISKTDKRSGNLKYLLAIGKGIDEGKTFAFGGFATPRVPAGTYTAVITKGRDVFEHTFDIINDNRAGWTKEDHKFKQDIMSKMYNMTEELAYMVYQIDTFLASPSTKSKVKTELENLKKTLVITTGDNYVGSAEPELREKLANLFSKIVGSYDKPSNNELENLKTIESRFVSSNKVFNKLKKKIKNVDYQSFESFLKE